jgi:DNA-binding IscR family transcriptional regulator
MADLGSRKGSPARRRTYRLARSAAEIPVVEVVEAVDGPLPAETPQISAERVALDRRLQDVCEESTAVVRSIREGVRLAELTAEKPTTKKESAAEGWRA